jgi:glycosyltransferase involved in cell wall biosynthesis
LISVVMAAYNAGSTLDTAIQSIVSQSYTDWELLVVDDASVDATSSIANDWASQDSRIRLLTLSENVGRAEARNTAIGASKRPVVAIADADDISLPSRLQLHLDMLEGDSTLAVVGGQVLHFGVWGEARQVFLYPTTRAGVDRRFQAGKMAIPHAACAFRRAWFEDTGGYDSRCHRAQDLELFLRGLHSRAAVNSADHVLLYRTARRVPTWAEWERNAASVAIAHEISRQRAVHPSVHARVVPRVSATIPYSGTALSRLTYFREHVLRRIKRPRRLS